MSPRLGSGGCRCELELEGFLSGLDLIELRLLLLLDCQNRSHIHRSQGTSLRLVDRRPSGIGAESSVSTGGYVLGSITLVGEVVEQVALAAAVHPWAPLDAHVVDLAVGSVAMEVEVEDGVRLRFFRATESYVGFSVAIGDHVGPFAAICLLAEGESFGTVEVEASAIDTVHELATVGAVSHLEVPELVRTFVRGLGGLQFGAVVAVHVDGILTRELVRSNVVVQETIGTELLLGHSVLAIDVGIALTSHGIRSVDVRAAGGALLVLLGRRCHKLVGLLLLVLTLGRRRGSKLVVWKLSQSCGIYGSNK